VIEDGSACSVEVTSLRCACHSHGKHPMDSANRKGIIMIAIILAYVLMIAGVLVWVDPPGKVPETITSPTTPTTP